MKSRPFKLYQLYKIAKEAMVYAQNQIYVCSTWEENNHLPDKIFNIIADSVDDARVADWYSPLEKDENLLLFEREIYYSSKFSMGNCEEFSMHALDYILNQQPDVNAELFEIGSKYELCEWSNDLIIHNDQLQKYKIYIRQYPKYPNNLEYMVLDLEDNFIHDIITYDIPNTNDF